MSVLEFVKSNGGRVAGLVAASLLAGGSAITTARAGDAAVAAQAAQAARPAARAAVAAVAPTVQKAVPAPAPAIAFAAPLPGFVVNSAFGMRRLPEEGRSRMHEGVDIAAPSGSVIRATASGRVAAAGISSSYGRYVEIDHGEGVSSFYAHMSKTAGLRVGAPVAAGGIVGYVGSTGHSTGPHLHFEIRKAGAQYDPSLFMGRAFASYDALPFRRSADLIRASAKGSLHASRAARPLRVAYAGGRVHTSIARG